MPTMNGDVRLQILSPDDIISRDNVGYRQRLAELAGNLEIPFSEVDHAFRWAEHGNKGVEKGFITTRPYGGIHVASVEESGGQFIYYGVQIRLEEEIDYQDMGHIVVTIYPLDHPKYLKHEIKTFGQYALIGTDKIGHIGDYFPYPGYKYSLANLGTDTSDLDSKIIEELLRSLRQDFDVLGVEISAHNEVISDIFARNGFLPFNPESENSENFVGYKVLEEID